MKIQLKRSDTLTNGSAQPPSVDQMEFGELAVNFAASDPTLFYKDNLNVIRDVKLGIFPDLSNNSLQSGTLDDRYVSAFGSTVQGNLIAPNFIGGVTRISATPPTATGPGELWYNTADGRIYIYFQDADSAQWVDASPDTFELGINYYDRSQSDARYLQLSGGTLSGTLNLSGTGFGTVLALQDGGATKTKLLANGTIFSGNAGEGTSDDVGFVLDYDGSFINYTPSSTSDSAIRFGIIRGTTPTCAITAAGDGFFNNIIGAGTGITSLTGSVVKTAYEAEADTNAFTDAEKTKLSGIETGAEVNVSTDLAFNATTRELSSSTGNTIVLPTAVGVTPGLISGADKGKLDGIENAATADQTGAEIKALYEAEANAFTDAQFTKLAGIETGATGDQTAAEIRVLVDAATDSNVFTDVEKTKLAALDETAPTTPNAIRDAVEAATNSNIFTDADHTKLDGIEAGAQVNAVTSVNGNVGAVVTARSFVDTVAPLNPNLGDIWYDSSVSTQYVWNDLIWAPTSFPSSAPVDSVNGQTGAVVLNADDIDDSTTVHKFATTSQLSKLDGIEPGATGDQTAAEIRALVDQASDSNVFTDGDKTDIATALAGALSTNTSGTFIPSLSSINQQLGHSQFGQEELIITSYYRREGRYVRMNNLVQVWIEIGTFNISWLGLPGVGDSDLHITGLPFRIEADAEVAATIGRMSNWKKLPSGASGQDRDFQITLWSQDTFAGGNPITGNATPNNNLTTNNLHGASNYIQIQMTYETA